MSKKDEVSQAVVHFDEHGMFELSDELAAQVGGAWPPAVTNLQRRVHDTLNPNGNHLCLPTDFLCGGGGQNGHCISDLVCT